MVVTDLFACSLGSSSKVVARDYFIVTRNPGDRSCYRQVFNIYFYSKTVVFRVLWGELFVTGGCFDTQCFPGGALSPRDLVGQASKPDYLDDLSSIFRSSGLSGGSLGNSDYVGPS